MLKSTWSSVGNLRKAFQDSSEEFTTPVTEETEMTEPKKEVDYEKMEKNLDRFEDLYEAFLSLTDANGEHNEGMSLTPLSFGFLCAFGVVMLIERCRNPSPCCRFKER